MTRSSPVPADGVSDHALLLGFAADDAITGGVFVRRFQARVYGVAVNLLGDPGLAEDVAQEAFVRAFRHATTYDPGRGSVAAWLSRITRNLAIDTLRRYHLTPVDAEILEALTPPSTASSVEDAAVSFDAAARIRAAVAELPPAQARAVWLAAFHGHTAQQIAASEGIPLGTAKTRIRTGLRALRAQLIDSDDTVLTVQNAPLANQLGASA
jgi:RNA polymerase sigma factor (sigma-70 family)